jgi:hypothetical protein
MTHGTGGFHSGQIRKSTPWIGLLILPLLAACASVPLPHGAALSSSKPLRPSDGLLTKARVSVEKDAVLAARTVQIKPTSFSKAAKATELLDKELDLVANAIGRSLCIGLSDRFRIVTPPETADLTVYVSIASILPTDRTAAAASKVISIGTSVATSAGVVETAVPIPSVRIPIGLGGLALEAEAVDAAGNQVAAMLWARGANSFFGTTRVSPIGDAYELASAFGNDFSELLVTGASPFGAKLPSVPSRHRVVSLLGGAPKEANCEAFGRVGVSNLVGGSIGLPPEWTDDGAQDTRAAQ